MRGTSSRSCGSMLIRRTVSGEAEAGCLEQPHERRPRRTRFAELDARDHRLGGAGLPGQLPLRQPGALARAPKEIRRVGYFPGHGV